MRHIAYGNILSIAGDRSDIMNNIKKSIITAVMIALCVVLPMALHGIPKSGIILSPMHFPVLLCGLVCGPVYGLFSGVVGVFLSSLLTGMPPAPVLPGMVVELFFYGLSAGILMKVVKTKNTVADVYVSLIGAMLIGRIAGGVAKALFFARGSFTLAAWASSYFVSTIPGMVLQLILLPLIYVTLEKSNLIPSRYTEY